MADTINSPTTIPSVKRVETPLDTIVRRIVEIVQPVKIILFGSSARGHAGPDSDLDLLVVMPDGAHRRRTAQHLYRELSGIGVPFDLVVATSSDLTTHADNPGLIYQTVLKEGRTVYAA
jgi:predicted nucleotidyltransferase